MPRYDNQLNLRLTRDDIRWVSVIAAHLGATSGSCFVTRAEAVRQALRSFAATLSADALTAAANAHQATTDAR